MRYLLTVDENGDSIDFVVTLNVGVVVVVLFWSCDKLQHHYYSIGN